MRLSAVESSISEGEAIWREGGAPPAQPGQGSQLRTLQGERESLLKEIRDLQNRMKSDSFLSLEEERRWVGDGAKGTTRIQLVRSATPYNVQVCPVTTE